jgi:hypothetical protein
LLVFTGQIPGPVHEKKLASKEADADGAGLERCVRIRRKLDVGQQVDRLPIERDRWRVTQLRQALSLLLALTLSKRYSSNTTEDGSTITMPASPSMMTQSSWRISPAGLAGARRPQGCPCCGRRSRV